MKMKPGPGRAGRDGPPADVLRVVAACDDGGGEARRLAAAPGLVVTTVQGPVELVRVCSRLGERVHLVVLDLALPTADLRTTVHLLRRFRPDTPILVALREGADEEVALRAVGAHGALLRTPYTLAGLHEQLARLLGSTRSPGATP
jgi:CheY-like chemotaxis protein